MKTEYDMSQAKCNAVLINKGKTRITIYLDDSILEEFRERAEAQSKGYQTLINEALSNALGGNNEPVTIGKLRQILREELNLA